MREVEPDPLPVIVDDGNHVNHVTVSLPANGGSGTYSYSKNSHCQRRCLSHEMEKIQDQIWRNLDVQSLCSVSNTIRVADFGCATGPNTFHTIHEAIEVIRTKYHYQTRLFPDPKMPEFQALFNDLPSNDFNFLFTSLPLNREYFVAGVPGSFYGRLFPESSIHLAFSTFTLHWLSKSPDELQAENSGAWNKGRIHYTNAPKEVVDAYAAQFSEDAGRFLEARAQELVSGGMLIIVMSGIPYGMPHSDVPTGLVYDVIGQTLLDLAKEGLIRESQVDSFNLPYYAASPKEMTMVIEKEGHFSIEKMELTNPAPLLVGPINIPEFIIHVRAAMEGLFIRQFGSEIIDDLFERSIKKLKNCSNELDSKFRDKTQLVVILKRKNM